jgi:succinyl-diaminopimelate desuccinylase
MLCIWNPVVAVAAIAGDFRHNEKQLKGEKMTTLSPAVALTRQLIGFDTRNPGGNEAECIDFLIRILKDAGFKVTTASFEDGRPSLVARWGEGKRPALCFAGHVDTVPLGSAPWQFDPFAGQIHEGRLYGRGACDMKGGVAAMVTAACRLAPRLAHGDDLILLIVAGEETGCQGSRCLAEQTERLGRAGALIVAEPSNNYPLVGHKGALWLSARFTGRTAHGAMPEKGDNAVYKATAAVERLKGFDFNMPAHPYLGPPTLNLGYFHGGLNINSVPDAAEMGIDIRTVPGLDHDELCERIQACLGPDAALSPIVDVSALWSDPESAWIQSVFDTVSTLQGERPEPRTVAFFTDGSPLQAAYAGIPTLVLGPGESAMAHQTDEYCLVEEIEAATALYQRIAEEWYGLASQD